MSQATIGTVVFQYQQYIETIIACEGKAQIVECKDGDTVKLYRIEKLMQPGYWTHTVAYSYPDAVKLFDSWKLTPGELPTTAQTQQDIAYSNFYHGME